MIREEIATSFAFFVLSLTLVKAQVEFVHTPCEKGKLIDGQLVGIWEYADRAGEKSLAIDYDNKRLVSIVKDTNDYHYFEDGTWKSGTLDIPARFLGSTEILIHHYLTSIEYPFKAGQKKIEGTVQLIFEVDTDGLAKNPQVIPELGGGITEVILDAFHRAPNLWVVGSRGGTAVPCKFKMIFQFCHRGCENEKIVDAKATTLYDARIKRPRIFTRIQEYLNGFGHPKFSPDGQKIAFTKTHGNFTQICIYDLATGSHEVVPFQANLRSFDWSPNNELYFDYDFLRFKPAIAKYSTESKEVTVLYQSASGPIVSAEHKLLFIQNYDESSRKIMISDLNRPDQLPVGAGLPANISPVSWSPDGRRILYFDAERTAYTFNFQSKEHRIVPLIEIFNYDWNNSDTLIVAQDFTNPRIFEVDLSSLRYARVNIKDPGLLKVFRAGQSNFLTFSRQQIVKHFGDGTKATIVKDVVTPVLSPDKLKLAYVDAKEKQIKVYHLRTGQSETVNLNQN